MICTDSLECYCASEAAREYICARTHYAYTTLRTVGENKVLQLNCHIMRLYTAIITKQGAATPFSEFRAKVIAHL